MRVMLQQAGVRRVVVGEGHSVGVGCYDRVIPEGG